MYFQNRRICVHTLVAVLKKIKLLRPLERNIRSSTETILLILIFIRFLIMAMNLRWNKFGVEREEKPRKVQLPFAHRTAEAMLFYIQELGGKNYGFCRYQRD